MTFQILSFADLAKVPLKSRAQEFREKIDVAVAAMPPVQIQGEELHRMFWRGRQWAVTAYGIEALDGTYAIAKERLAEAAPDKPGLPIACLPQDLGRCDRFHHRVLCRAGRSRARPQIQEGNPTRASGVLRGAAAMTGIIRVPLARLTNRQLIAEFDKCFCNWGEETGYPIEAIGAEIDRRADAGLLTEQDWR